ncbi:MAG TPA: sulfur carrier protein ThiS [Candidatus Binatia bacterium]|nr:sulfur carrier protein ThiS [Candidatus Binatia bacterium]
MAEQNRDELETVFPGHRWWYRECGFFWDMKVRINGEEKEIADGLSIAGLLEELQIRPGRVVIELNQDVVSRAAHGSTLLKEGDALEIVHFVGGG